MAWGAKAVSMVAGAEAAAVVRVMVEKVRATAEAVRVLAMWVAAVRVVVTWVVAGRAEMVVKVTAVAVRAMVEAATAMAGATRAGTRALAAKATGGVATDREAARTVEVGLVAHRVELVVGQVAERVGSGR